METIDIELSPLPLVLIVEDKPRSLRRRRQLFESFGCVAVGVDSTVAAIRELHRTPLVDLVVTDVHMPSDDADEADTSGVDLAKYVKNTFRDIPVAGYSAYFSESQLQAARWDVFDLSFPRGGQSSKALQNQVEKCVGLAVDRRRDRIASLEEKLSTLRREYESLTPDLEVVRRMALDDAKSDSTALVEGPLGKAGYKLRLIAATDQEVPTEPFVVWSCGDSGGTLVEVYGYPELYAFGGSEHDAIALLSDLMSLFDQELRDTEHDMAPKVRELANFLNRVLPNGK